MAERSKELENLKNLIVSLAYDRKKKAKERAVITNIECDYSKAPLRPSRIPLRSPTPFTDNPVNGNKEEEPRSRSKFIKFANPPKFFN